MNSSRLRFLSCSDLQSRCCSPRSSPPSAAGALVLPTAVGDYPGDLDEYFEEDGRWGVALIGAFQLTAIVANTTLFEIPLAGLMNLWNVTSIALITILLATKRRAVHSAVTIVFGLWLGVYLLTFVPTTY